MALDLGGHDLSQRPHEVAEVLARRAPGEVADEHRAARGSSDGCNGGSNNCCYRCFSVVKGGGRGGERGEGRGGGAIVQVPRMSGNTERVCVCARVGGQGRKSRRSGESLEGVPIMSRLVNPGLSNLMSQSEASWEQQRPQQ